MICRDGGWSAGTGKLIREFLHRIRERVAPSRERGARIRDRNARARLSPGLGGHPGCALPRWPARMSLKSCVICVTASFAFVFKGLAVTQRKGVAPQGSRLVSALLIMVVAVGRGCTLFLPRAVITSPRATAQASQPRWLSSAATTLCPDCTRRPPGDDAAFIRLCPPSTRRQDAPAAPDLPFAAGCPDRSAPL